MSVFGGIGFTAPWLLLALLALPILWLILRAVPPAPILRRFPGVALLLKLSDDESVSDRTPWWLLLLDCACSVGFNLTMLRFIGTLSAVNYALYSLLKDIALLTIAFLFFSEELYASRIEGWAVTICGCMVWQHRKLRERRNLQ